MRIPSRSAVFTAFVAGQAAGLAMLVVAMLLAGAQGRGVLYPLQVFTALAVGEPALHHLSLGSVLPGLLAHQAGPTVLWSRAFGLVVGLSKRRYSPGRALALGVAIGAIALLIDAYLLMPGIQRQLNGHNIWAQNVPRWEAWVMHLVFGASLGLFYWRWQPRG